MTYEGAVVVGVDDETPDLVVLRWAAAEALHRRARLVVCHVCEWRSGQHAPAPMARDVPPDRRIGPEWVVGETLDLIRSEHPDLPVSGAIGSGDPARGLLTVSREAALVVVGAPGSGAHGPIMASVSGKVAEHGRCPVAVVRAVSGSAVDVAVGVDGSPGSAAAVALALEEVRRTGGTLVAVHAYQLPSAATYGMRTGSDVVSHRWMAEERMSAALGDIECAHPDVKVERHVVHGPTARVLLNAAGGAAMLVVGTRGRGGVPALVLGSVSRQVLRQATGPVLVAH